MNNTFQTKIYSDQLPTALIKRVLLHNWFVTQQSFKYIKQRTESFIKGIEQKAL